MSTTSTLLDDNGAVTDSAATIPHEDVQMWKGDDGLERIVEATCEHDEYCVVNNGDEWMVLGRPRQHGVEVAAWTIIDTGTEDHARNVFDRTVGRSR